MSKPQLYASGDVILDLDTEFAPTVNDDFHIECVDGNPADAVMTRMFKVSGRQVVAGEDFELEMFCDKDADHCTVQLAVSHFAFFG